MVQRRCSIEGVANVERVDVDDADGAVFLGYHGADIGAATGTKQVVGDAEAEAVARQGVWCAAESTLPVGSPMVRAPWRRQKLQAQRPTRISSGVLSEVRVIAIAPQWQEPG